MADDAEPTRVGSALRYLSSTNIHDTQREGIEMANGTMKVRRAQGADAEKNDKLEADGDGVPSLAAPAPSALGATAPAATEGPAVRRYKVWNHGTFQHDGEVYEPGALLTLPVALAKGVECLEPV